MLSPSEKPTYLIRADAGSQVGQGHAMRSFALAQVLSDYGESVVFTGAGIPEHLKTKLRQETFAFKPLEITDNSKTPSEQFLALVNDFHNPMVVLDGYHFSQEYNRVLLDETDPVGLLVFDDIGTQSSSRANFLLNQNLHASRSFYSSFQGEYLLLGRKYLLLRREFRERNRPVSEVESTGNVLLCFGGGTRQSDVTYFLNLLSELKSSVTVRVTGASDIVDNSFETTSDIDVRICPSNVSMPEQMKWADLALSAAGSTAWELAYMGVPMVLFSVADNQIPVARALKKQNAAVFLGEKETLDPGKVRDKLDSLLTSEEMLNGLRKSALELFDEHGGRRILSALNTLRFTLDPATENDCKPLWKLSNQPEVRRASFDTTKIPFEEHRRWFQQRLNDERTWFYVARSHNNPGTLLGQVRFERDDTETVISVSLDQNFRGKGLGSSLIWDGCYRLFSETSVRNIQAYIKETNQSSMTAFEYAGFEFSDSTMVEDTPTNKMTLDRDHLGL